MSWVHFCLLVETADRYFLKNWSDEKYDLTIDHMNSINTQNQRIFIQIKIKLSAPKKDIALIFLHINHCKLYGNGKKIPPTITTIENSHKTQPELPVLARDYYLLVFFVSLNPLTFYLNVLLFQYFVQYLRNGLERKIFKSMSLWNAYKLVLQNPLFRLIFCNMTSSLSHVPIHKQCANLTFPQFLL